MREQGAASVLGLDLSANMIRRAKADTKDPEIEYRIADLDTLELPKAAFDFAYSALTFHYIKDFNRLVRMLHQALVPGGDLVFTIEHPIFMAAVHPHWIVSEDGSKSWPVSRYSIEGERQTDWFTGKRRKAPGFSHGDISRRCPAKLGTHASVFNGPCVPSGFRYIA